MMLRLSVMAIVNMGTHIPSANGRISTKFP